jgi:hypothetical protein
MSSLVFIIFFRFHKVSQCNGSACVHLKGQVFKVRETIRKQNKARVQMKK